MQKVSEQQAIILDLIQKNKKLTDDKERYINNTTEKIKNLEDEKDRAI